MRRPHEAPWPSARARPAPIQDFGWAPGLWGPNRGWSPSSMSRISSTMRRRWRTFRITRDYRRWTLASGGADVAQSAELVPTGAGIPQSRRRARPRRASRRASARRSGALVGDRAVGSRRVREVAAAVRASRRPRKRALRDTAGRERLARAAALQDGVRAVARASRGAEHRLHAVRHGAAGPLARSRSADPDRTEIGRAHV